MIYELGDLKPEFRGNYFVADNARVIGQCIFENNVSIWFGAILRADNDRITIGENSNVQDNSVVHADPGFPVNIGRDVTVGHLVMLHGCSVGDGSLIGIKSVILNGAVIGKECLIGANTLIPEGKIIPDRSLVVGSPGKVMRQLSDEDVAGIREGVSYYVEKITHYREHLKAI
ncbi:MAG: gamma carbonic anhydrase family protein [Burkholderiales bacterium]|nr:gamma carbonic anhydrase family protein [Pseudomonadota bacterium]